MRVLAVSAHFPPNFVSGATLAAQRQTAALAEMGHEVSVYAGWIDLTSPRRTATASAPATDRRQPLETWTDAEETVVPVRWIVTTPWIDWADRGNYDNAAVARDFAAHLEEVRPDVVHFHSVQSLGASLLSVAADAGARVVVTMHDFWWSCARQFFVDRGFQPCCPVVSCSVCSCEVDRSWLDERNAVLREHLARADVVLAVSTSAAELIAANGLEPEKLRVDENGLPDHPSETGGTERSDARPTGDVTFGYVGGHEPMKGVHVLLDAVDRLRHRPGWRLTAYGIDRFLREARFSLAGLPVDARPRFDPRDADRVFAAIDVLVVPSVMRESHSLVTREALTRGIPVVCTESGGPEEVVEHDRNGLVVPPADAPALAAALGRLVDEPALVATLRAGCRAVPVRSLSDQVAGLDRLYRELAASDGDQSGDRRPATALPRGAPRRTVRQVLFLVGIEGAPLRYRARLPAEALATLGVGSQVRHYRDAEGPALAADADAVVLYRVPATHQVLDLVEQVRARGVPVFFDVDDLIFDPDLHAEIPALSILPPDDAALWLEGVRRYRTTMEACDAFIGSTTALCRHAEAVVGLPAARFPNGVGMLLGQVSDFALARPRAGGPVRVGYLSGTKTHDHDWLHVEPAVVRLLDARPEVDLWLGGLVTPSHALDRFAERVRRLPLLPWGELPRVLRNLDVNLAPLAPGSRFNEAKSAIKWLEAALTATPTVASPTEPFLEAIRPGANGLVAGDADEWFDAMCLLVDDEELRSRLGRRARLDALLRWSPHLQARRYLDILECTPTTGRAGRSSWAAVAHDEPLLAVALEPYQLPAELAPAPVPSRPVARPAPPPPGSLAHVCRRSLREHGLSGTARRAVRAGGRRFPHLVLRLRDAGRSARRGVGALRQRS